MKVRQEAIRAVLRDFLIYYKKRNMLMNMDAHGADGETWIGFDLDGTLAAYDGWKGIAHIGSPIARMVLIAKLLHGMGRKIKILTARVAPNAEGDEGKARAYVEQWCRKHLGFVPEVTYVKDALMDALFDDRAVAVRQNTGEILGGWPETLPHASETARRAVRILIEDLKKGK